MSDDFIKTDHITQQSIELSEKEFLKLQIKLDALPKSLPKLRKLLSGRSVLDKD